MDSQWAKNFERGSNRQDQHEEDMEDYKVGSIDYALTVMNKGLSLVNMAERVGGIEAVRLLEQAIDYCDTTTSILDVNTMAAEYALAQQSRGIARYRLAEVSEGTKGIILFEQAIACYEIALKIRDRTSMAPLHAKTQINKGTALQALAERRAGAEGEALFELAISCYDVAIDIIDRTTDPFFYAMAQQNKANALRTLAERRTGAAGIALLEQAIACCDTALIISDTVTTPLMRVAILLNKGAVLEALAESQEGVKRVRGLEQAIECFDAVLILCDRTSMASPYASAQMNKGNALRELARLGPEAEAMSLFEQAITCYDAALALRDRISMAPQHAKTQLNKGGTLLLQTNRLAGSQAVLLVEQAIDCFNMALEIYDRTTMAPQHAGAQMNKGNALHRLAVLYPLTTQQARDKAVSLLKESIDCFNVALEIYSSMNGALGTTETQVNKGLALMEMIAFCEGIEKKRDIVQTHQELFLSNKEISNLTRLIAFYRQQGNITMAISGERYLAFLEDARRHGINVACDNFEKRQATEKQIAKLTELVNTYFSFAQSPNAVDKQIPLIRQYKELCLADANMELLQSALAQAQRAQQISTVTELQRLYERFIALHKLAVHVATLDAFGDVLEAKTWQDLQSILEKALIYVSSDKHLAWQKNSINRLRTSGKTKEAEESEGYFQLFYNARFFGIENACKRFKMRRDHEMVQRLDITDAVQALLDAPDASTTYEILQEQEELLRLHSDLAMALIHLNIGEHRERDELDTVAYLEQYLHLLENLKEHGLVVAWQNFQLPLQSSISSSYVYRLMGEYYDLPGIPENMQRKIELLNLILKSPEGEQTPGLKAIILAERGACYLETPEGENAENVEQAIKDITIAIESFHHVHELFPKQEYLEQELHSNDRATLYGSLGSAYHQRIYGTAADNVEKALEYFQAALDLCDQDTKESTMAGILISRGNAYKDRIRGERPENIELAIQNYITALEILNGGRKEDAYGKATVHLNLGSAYRQRLSGVLADNIEQALEHYDAAFEGFTREATPIDWAMTLMGRGNAYLDRVRGEPSINNDNAIADFDAALGVLTFEHAPGIWANVHMNRGNAYVEREHGDQAKNLRQAIEDFDAALTVFTHEKAPKDWAQTHRNRGNVSLAAARNEKVSMSSKVAHLEKAIVDYNAAHKIFTYDTFPHEWAAVCINRGAAYSLLPTGTMSTNLQQSLLDFDAALEVFTLKAMPRLYRNTLIYRASVLKKLGRWEDAHKTYIALREVIQLLLETATNNEERAEILREEAHRNIYLEDAQVLLHCDPPDLKEAICVLEEGRAQNLRATLDLDTVTTYHAKSSQAHERIQSFLAARDAWREAQSIAATPLSIEMSMEERSAKIAQRRRHLDDIYAKFTHIRELIRTLDNPAFLAPASDFVSIAQAIPSKEAALVYLVPGETTGQAFIITRDQSNDPQAHYILLPLLKWQTLIDLLITKATISLVGYSGITQKVLFTGGWLLGQRQAAFPYFQMWGLSFDNACSLLPEGSSFKTAALHLIATSSQDPRLRTLLDQPFTTLNGDEQAYLEFSFNRIVLSLELQKVLRMLGELAMSELARSLQKQNIQKVTLIPYGLLGLFPLPSSLIRHSGEQCYLSDIFEVALAPNARAVQIAHDRIVQLSHQEHPVVLTVGNPLPLPYERGSLPFAETEADTIQRIAQALYPTARSHSLITTEATKKVVVQELERAWYAHMAVHGNYHYDEPRRSRLVLAGDEHVPEEERSLYLSEALDGSVNLRGVRLLVLSACETALIDTEQLDEVLGLATGFLQAGASGIIASLWAVDDRATYLLMSRFAQLYLDPRRNRSPAQALAEAQRWLREVAANRVLKTYDPTKPEPLVSALIPEHTPTQENCSVAGEFEQIDSTLRSLRYDHLSGLATIHDRAERQSLESPDSIPYADPIYWAAFVVTGC